ncbi:mechanosensitive ion channel [Roseateles sp.]|uniref:mechanosensitive ion channel n=1 Tax=Roseateles sp. TaxID=1971397 RepID=UPI003D10DB97
MNQWNDLLSATGSWLGPFAPKALGAGALLLVAWLLARLARSAVSRVAAARGIEARLQTPGLTDLLANIAYWLVWLFALPALLGALELEGLLTPVNAMMARLLSALPGVMGAVVVFGVGFLAARILRELVTGVLTAAGSERLAARIGLGTALGDRTLASVIGSAVFLLVLLPTLSAALQTLGLEVVAKPVGRLFDSVIDLVPRLISAGLIVAIGAILGRMLAGLLTALLAGLGLNRLPGQLGMPPDWRLGGRDPSELAGGALMVAAVLLALTQACEVLGFAVLTEAVASLGGLLAHLAAALVIFGAGLWLAAVAGRAVSSTAAPNAKVLAHLARAVILFFTAALALRQAGLPADIVTIAFGCVFGAVALAVAIAAGVGGRHVAARLLEAAVASFEKKKDDSDAQAR